jgi:hypothetical protein
VRVGGQQQRRSFAWSAADFFQPFCLAMALANNRSTSTIARTLTPCGRRLAIVENPAASAARGSPSAQTAIRAMSKKTPLVRIMVESCEGILLIDRLKGRDGSI